MSRSCERPSPVCVYVCVSALGTRRQVCVALPMCEGTPGPTQGTAETLGLRARLLLEHPQAGLCVQRVLTHLLE